MNAFDWKDLSIIAVQGEAPPVAPWRALPVVYALTAQPNRFVWPETQTSRHLHGRELDPETLTELVSQGLLVPLETPLVAAPHHVLVHTSEGYELISEHERAHRAHNAVNTWLEQAITCALGHQLESALQLLDLAYLVDPWMPLPVILRAGCWIHCAEQRSLSSSEAAVNDLARVVEAEGEPKNVRWHPLWTTLPGLELREHWLELATLALLRRERPRPVLEPPVPSTRFLVEAYLLESWRASGGRPLLRHDQTRRLCRGETSAWNELGERLTTGTGENWTQLEARAEHEPQVLMRLVAKTRSGRHALAMVHLAALEQHACTFRTLEAAVGDNSRHETWQSFRARSATRGRYRVDFPWEEGRQLAEDLRADLNLGEAPILSMRDLLQHKVGAAIFPLALPTGDVDALGLLPHGAPPCIYVNFAQDAATRRATVRRFALAHELAHLVFDRSTAPTLEKVCHTSARGEDEQSTAEEQRASSFAAYFLAPPGAVKQCLKKLELLQPEQFRQATRQISERFGMGFDASAQHIANCHRDHPERQRLRELVERISRDATNNERHTKQWEKAEALDILEPSDAEIISLERRGVFARKVREACSTGTIDWELGARLLGTATDGIRESIA